MFRFEPLKASDLSFLIDVRNGCRHFLHCDRSFSLGEAEIWFRDSRPNFRIILWQRQRIGYFRLGEEAPGSALRSIGADLHPDFRGRGLAFLAYQSFIPILQKESGASSLFLRVLSHNVAALRLYHKLGFRETGRQPHSIPRDGLLVEDIRMQLELPPVTSVGRP